jgi:hypothetical protein
MILIEERNSGGNAFYDKLKQTHEKNYFSCTRPIIDKYWEEDDARRARDTKMGIIRKPRSDAEEKDIARLKEEWQRYENRTNYEAIQKESEDKYEPTSGGKIGHIPPPTEEQKKALQEKYKLGLKEYEDEDKLRARQKKKHTKPRVEQPRPQTEKHHPVGPRDAPSVSTVPKPKPCVSNSEYLRWYNGVKNGDLAYNSFAAKPYIEYAKRLIRTPQ